MRYFILFITIIILLLSPKIVHAIENPLKSTNNIFGIHILNESELKDAANLVNSSGGDWGYVTIVIQKGERDTSRWQKVFDEARRLHLIPIVRVASAQQDDGWEKPNIDEIDGWVSFLNSLNWVVKNRYVVIANEPNHTKEWGGDINPSEYAVYLRLLSEKLKANSSDFFILPAGLDFSAKNTKETMDASIFMKKVLESDPEFFNYIDGWTSHSYPNPGFIGSEKDSGRGTVGSFVWEIDYLKTLGLEKELPVFITETGWQHQTSSEPKKGIPIEKVGPKLIYSFENVWNNPQVVAVTPFLLSYEDKPFDVFSWKNKDGTYYEFYNQIKEVKKTRGIPKRITSSQIIASFTPLILGKHAVFNGALLVRNTGQTILNEDAIISIDNPNGFIEIINLYNLPKIEPFNNSLLIFQARSPKEDGLYLADLALTKEREIISNKKNIKLYIFSLIDPKFIFQKIFSKD